MCQRWEPWPLKFACSPDMRSPKALVSCLAQFDVEHNERYKPEKVGSVTNTFCNIYCTDATRALECEIPHWVSTTGAPCAVGKGKELTALGMIMWLKVYGDEYGWKKLTDRHEADAHAAAGRPVVVCWENPQTTSDGRRCPSHVAMLLPPVNGESRIAQAGASNLFNAPLTKGFGTIRDLDFWWHE